MKTVEEFVKEINASEKLQKEIAEIKDKASLEGFLTKNGCDATAEEFAKFVETSGEGEISDETAGEIAGGIWLGTMRSKYWSMSGGSPSDFDW